MRKTAVFGGSFDPVHNGHLRLISACCEALEADRALLIPANLPPHKQGRHLTRNEDRLAMCRIAARELPFAEVSDIEINSGGKSYTVYTMERLKELYPQDTFFFVMGTDMFLCFDKWYQWKRILSLCSLAVSGRKEADFALIQQKAEQMRKDYPFLKRDFVHLVPSACIDISSTQLRRMLSCGEESAERYLPAGVYAYIVKRGLYRDENAGKRLEGGHTSDDC